MTDSPYDSFEFSRHGHKFIARLYHDSDTGAPWEEHDGHGPVSDWVRPGYTGRAPKRPGQRPIGDSDHGARRFYDWQEAMVIAKRDGWGFLPGELETRQVTATTWEAKCPGFVALGSDINEAIRNLYASHKASMTPGQYAAGAVQRDYDRLDRWARDLWHWCGVSVSPMVPSYERLQEAIESVLDENKAATITGIRHELQEALDAGDGYAPEDFSNALWGIESDAGDYLQEVANELADEFIANMGK